MLKLTACVLLVIAVAYISGGQGQEPDTQAYGCTPFQCPYANNTCLGGYGIYADPCNCNAFYECLNCQQYHGYCPENFVFDPDLGVCVTQGQYDCQVSTFEYSTTSGGVGGTEGTVQPIDATVFSVALNNPLSEPEAVMRYPRVFVNQGQYYNPFSGVFTAPRTSYYWFSISAGAEQHARCNMGLHKDVAVRVFDIYSNSTIRNGHTEMSRSAIVRGLSGQDFYTHMAASTEVYSSPLAETAWVAFDAQALFSPFMAFSAGNNRISNTSGAIFWDIVTLDTHSEYNPYTATYTAPSGGLYYVTISAATASGDILQVRLHSNRAGRIYDLKSTTTNNNGVVMTYNSIIMPMVYGEQLTTILDSGVLYSDAEMQTGITVLHYSPITPGTAVAFHAYTLVSWDATQGVISPFKFAHTTCNLNAAYDLGAGKFNVPVSGNYYFNINAGSVDHENLNFNMWVQSMNTYAAGISRNVTNTNGWLTMGRSIVLALSAGDSVWMDLMAGSMLYSDETKPTSWTGFLVSSF